MSTPVRKALKVQTSESGRRYVPIREVVKGQLERIKSEKEHRDWAGGAPVTSQGERSDDKASASGKTCDLPFRQPSRIKKSEAKAVPAGKGK